MITNLQAEKILEEIQKAKKILLHCHPNPDGDSIGSTLAMYHALKDMGKEATLIKGDSDIPNYLSFLPGINEIEKKNFFEVDLTKYDLFLILDSANQGHISKLGEVTFPASLQTIVIDHHISNVGYGKMNIVDSDYPAVCQMIFDLLKIWNVKLTQEIATDLFIGIYTDTGGFKYRGTTTKTISAVAELVDHIPDFTALLFKLENNNTKGKIKLQAMMLDSVETWFSDSVAVASASNEEMVKQGINSEDIAGNDVANILKTVKGWKVGVSVIEQEKGKVKVSFRSREDEGLDVSEVSVMLGGGGHKFAAGTTILGTISDAKAKIKQVLKETFPDIV